MATERRGALSEFVIKRIQLLREGHQRGLAAARAYEESDEPLSPLDHEISRRGLFWAGGVLAGAAAVKLPEFLDSGEKRAAFPTFVALVNKHTRLGEYYPGGFDRLGDNDLASLFDVEAPEAPDPETGDLTTRYALSLPNASDDVPNTRKLPAIEVDIHSNFFSGTTTRIFYSYNQRTSYIY